MLAVGRDVNSLFALYLSGHGFGQYLVLNVKVHLYVDEVDLKNKALFKVY